MAGTKCKNCGSGEIDTDLARGDSVCTNCGSVVENSIIVSTIQFEERTTGAVSVLGQFVSSDSKGAPRGLGPHFQSGIHTESRELTLGKAKRKITQLAQILKLNHNCIEMAYNFFKMALGRQLTRGRRTEHVIGACLYMTCRLEGTAHMLIDFCDALDIGGIFALGRTFLKLSSLLCIRVPSPDPSLFIMRFAGSLNFGSATHAVTMTAIRLIQRMKRDSMHTGRRASGLCGAALLMAARLHEFNRTVNDIVSIVKVHESTLRKRLMEFGDTPSSLLSLDEFMSVDLEDEQDPPSFKAARKKDRNVGKIPTEEELDDRFIALQVEIENELRKTKKAKKTDTWDTPSSTASDLAMKSTVEALNNALADLPSEYTEAACQGGIPPTFESLRLDQEARDEVSSNASTVDLEEIDEKDLDRYILTPSEVETKNECWMISNADFLEKEKEREELKKSKDAKPERKRRKPFKRNSKNQPIHGSAFEAIEKVLQEKKLSAKINYEVLKNLSLPPPKPAETEVRPPKIEPKLEDDGPIIKKFKPELEETDAEEEFEEDVEEPQPETSQMSLADLLQHHHNDDDNDNYGYDDDEY